MELLGDLMDALDNSSLPHYNIDAHSLVAIDKETYRRLKMHIGQNIHCCPNAFICGLVGTMVPTHAISHYKCHPLYFQQKVPFKKIPRQGKCVLFGSKTEGSCPNTNATGICLKCSTVDKISFICNISCCDKVGRDCLSIHNILVNNNNA